VLTGVAHITGFGNGLDNYLIGNTGNNTLDGGVGADTMTGGVGNDTYFVDNTGDIISELAGQGTDTVISSVTRYLGSNQENLTLTGASALNGYGSNDDNFLQGNSAANLLSGRGRGGYAGGWPGQRQPDRRQRCRQVPVRQRARGGQRRYAQRFPLRDGHRATGAGEFQRSGGRGSRSGCLYRWGGLLHRCGCR
jgi:hypothetical protein